MTTGMTSSSLGGITNNNYSVSKPARSSSSAGPNRQPSQISSGGGGCGVKPSHSHTNTIKTNKSTSSTQTRITGQRFYSPEKLPAFHMRTGSANVPRGSASHSNVAAAIPPTASPRQTVRTVNYVTASASNTQQKAHFVDNNNNTRTNAIRSQSQSRGDVDSMASRSRARTATASGVGVASSVSSTSTTSRVDSKSTQTQGRMVKLSESGLVIAQPPLPLSQQHTQPPPPPPPPPAIRSSVAAQLPLPGLSHAPSPIPAELIEELSIRIRSGSMPPRRPITSNNTNTNSTASPFSRAVPEHSTSRFPFSYFITQHFEIS